jgi:hypothetical protein
MMGCRESDFRCSVVLGSKLHACRFTYMNAGRYESAHLLPGSDDNRFDPDRVVQGPRNDDDDSDSN